MTMTQPQPATRPSVLSGTCVICQAELPEQREGILELRSCPNCGHRYLWGVVSETERRRRIDERDAGRSDEARKLADLRRVLVDRRDGLIRFHQDIAPLRLPCRILDTSAAMGGFLWAAKSGGFQVTGLERSARQRQLARHYHDIELLDGDLLDNQLPTSCADIVVLSRDLDESGEPRALLNAARRLVAPNGSVLVESGDAEGLDYPGADAAGLTSTTAVITNAIEASVESETAGGESEWSLLSYPHRFTGAELVRLLGETGFNLIDLYCPSEKVIVAIGAPA